MIALNHVLAGTLIAVITPAEYTLYIPIIALLSHFVLDAFPHYGNDEEAPVGSRRFRRIVQFDALLCVVAFGLALYLYPESYFWLGVGAFFAAAPDLLWLVEHKARRRIATLYFAFAKKIQWGERSWAWSLDILYAMIMISVLIGLS